MRSETFVRRRIAGGLRQRLCAGEHSTAVRVARALKTVEDFTEFEQRLLTSMAMM